MSSITAIAVWGHNRSQYGCIGSRKDFMEVEFQMSLFVTCLMDGEGEDEENSLRKRGGRHCEHNTERFVDQIKKERKMLSERLCMPTISTKWFRIYEQLD
jgi:hypothetical protein